MTKPRKFRDATTGEYVKPSFAEANPGTTVGEKPSERAQIVAWLHVNGYPAAARKIEDRADQEQP
jgi:hypothetical protein